jgi:hypothetical protein
VPPSVQARSPALVPDILLRRASCCVLHVLSDILAAVDCGDLDALVLLDLCAAFDSVESISIFCWSVYGGRSVSQPGLSCCQSDRTIGASVAAAPRHVRSWWDVTFRRARTWVPILFQQYAVDLLSAIKRHELTPRHLYADDLAHRVTPTDSERVATCNTDVVNWMRSNYLQLNIDKTDLLRCSSSRRQHHLAIAVSADIIWRKCRHRSFGGALTQRLR